MAIVPVLKFNYLLIPALLVCLMTQSFDSSAQRSGGSTAIYSGVPWFDQHMNVVSARGANILRDNNTFYLFGEAHTDTSNAFAGFNTYSSKDLSNWKFEGQALKAQQTGKLGPNRVGERVKVMKNPKSGLYCMYMHVDTLGYKDQFVGYAVATKVTGPYVFKGPLLFEGKPVRKWDMGIFQDKDGTGYILLHGGDIYKLSDDYQSITSHVNKAFTPGFESPTMFRKGNTYYFIGSNLTSWEKNDNYYYTSNTLEGPWVSRGLIAPKETLTWNSQITSVLTVEGLKDTAYIFMGDRWSYPKQLSSATYVWQPLSVKGNELSMPQYLDSWTINMASGMVSENKNVYQLTDNIDQSIMYTGNWQQTTTEFGTISRSAIKGDSFSLKFKGKRIVMYAVVLPDNGYALCTLQDKKGKEIARNIVDLYAKAPRSTMVYQSPLLTAGEYTLKVEVTGERPNWSDKRKSNYGSTANNVSLDKLVIEP